MKRFLAKNKNNVERFVIAETKAEAKRNAEKIGLKLVEEKVPDPPKTDGADDTGKSDTNTDKPSNETKDNPKDSKVKPNLSKGKNGGA